MPYEGPILTADEIRSAEKRAIDAGTSDVVLMERAGAGAAEAIRRYAGGMPALILCGPGNNGGDGYVIARHLRAMGNAVRVAAAGMANSGAAAEARAAWDGSIEGVDDAAPEPLLIDALFGTGLSRGLDERLANKLMKLGAAACVRVAVDLPSGAKTDTGAMLSPVPHYDLTITFGAPKPAHFLQPAADHVGRLVVADIGLVCNSELGTVPRPRITPPGPGDHKYKRGYVLIRAGEMPGAAGLVAASAARAGAGYVRLLGDRVLSDIPHAIVQGGTADEERAATMVIGPGLGRSERARMLLGEAISSSHGLVIDADALHLLEACPLPNMPILTPHEGEFVRLFGALPGSKLEKSRQAARTMNGVIVFKGADTVVAAPDGRAAIANPPGWLATAGTGDVLAGVVGAMRARGLEPFEAACAAVWLHSRAAELAGPNLIADDLTAFLSRAGGECL